MFHILFAGQQSDLLNAYYEFIILLLASWLGRVGQ